MSTDRIRAFLSRVTGVSISTPLGGFGLSWRPETGHRSGTPPLSRPETRDEAKPADVLPINADTELEPYFWLAQTLVGWSISESELMYEQFELQANTLGIKVARGNEIMDEFLSKHLEEIDSAVRTTHGESACNVFRFGVLVSFLPMTFNNNADLRSLKATCESVALRAFGSAGLAATTSFLKGLPCEIPMFVEQVQQLKELLQKAVSQGRVA